MNDKDDMVCSLRRVLMLGLENLETNGCPRRGVLNDGSKLNSEEQGRGGIWFRVTVISREKIRLRKSR